MFQEPEAGAYIYMHIRKVSWALLFEYARNETEVSRTFASLPLTCYYTTKCEISCHLYMCTLRNTTARRSWVKITSRHASHIPCRWVLVTSGSDMLFLLVSSE
jgi:hypothetical protein